MSKNITIQEGGITKQLTADKLKTDLVGGGTCLWVPEDEVRLANKTISEDGTYKASDEGYYGYSQVTVHGIGRATGRDPQTGDEKTVTTDPNTGDLVETILPVEIRITTMPTKLEYVDGENIDISGMVVKAYRATGTEYGTVPNNELSIEPSKATAEGGGGQEGSATSDLRGNLTQPIVFLPAGKRITMITSAWEDYVAAQFHCDTIWCINNDKINLYAMSDDPQNIATYDVKQWRKSWGQEEPAEWSKDTLVAAQANYTHNDKTVYYGSKANWWNPIQWMPQPPFIHTANYPNELDAWTVVYGDRNVGPEGTQTIGVSWPRSDGRILTTTFRINVQET